MRFLSKISKRLQSLNFQLGNDLHQEGTDPEIGAFLVCCTVKKLLFLKTSGLDFAFRIWAHSFFSRFTNWLRASPGSQLSS